jgi:hypothetical protein
MAGVGHRDLEGEKEQEMPSQKGKSALLAKLGDRIRKAHEEHKNDDTTLGTFSRLPPGINGGIAQLVRAEAVQIPPGKERAGEYQVVFTGVVKQPTTFMTQDQGEVTTVGMQTRLFVPLYDTPTRKRKSLEDNWAWLLEVLRSFGVDTASMGWDDLEETLKALQEAAPHFRFRTWLGSQQTEGQYKDRPPRVNEDWEKMVDYDEETGEASGGAFTDGTSTNGEPVDEFGRDNEHHSVNAGNGQETESPDADADAEDLDALAEAAAADDDDAIARLHELGMAAGLTKVQIDKAKTWEWVVEKIREATPEEGEGGEGEGGEGEEPEPEEPEEKTLAVGDPVRYKPVNPKTKKVGKAVECKVTALYAAKKTADLLNLDDKKTRYSGVSWDALEY